MEEYDRLCEAIRYQRDFEDAEDLKNLFYKLSYYRMCAEIRIARLLAERG